MTLAPTPQEAPVSKRFNLTDLTDQLTAQATRKPQEAQQRPDPTPAPSLPPQPQEEAPERRTAPRVWRTLQTPEGTVPNARTLAREARAHAEAWYQALREWETHTKGGDLVYGTGPRNPKTGRMQVVGVGSYGGPPVAALSYTTVRTPLGWLSESSVAQAMSRSGEELLEPIRRGAGLATLIHASGRGWAGEQARAYGRAVLRLAAGLGDSPAAFHLSQLQNEEKPSETT